MGVRPRARYGAAVQSGPLNYHLPLTIHHCHLPFTTYHLPYTTATYHLPFTIYHLPFTIYIHHCHLPFTIYCLTPTYAVARSAVADTWALVPCSDGCVDWLFGCLAVVLTGGGFWLFGCLAVWLFVCLAVSLFGCFA